MSVVSARLIGVTTPTVDDIPDADAIMAYCARVSNPQNQTNHETADRLLAYCAKHAHWSVFTMANVLVEVEAPRDISRQLLRHCSFKFQEFSQRYAVADRFCVRELRLQDSTNRQNSLPVDDTALHDEWMKDQGELIEHIKQLQHKWLVRGAAKEVIRVINPEGLTMSRLYLSANIRDIWHYYQVRKGNGTQKEHSDLAVLIAEEVAKAVPETWKGLENTCGG